MSTLKDHWEKIYSTKSLTEVSWYQPSPETSLRLIEACNLPKDAAIIDIGGGDSFLVDNLLKLGYSNVTVLDISEKAIVRAKLRLMSAAKEVNWIVSDINDFEPEQTYDLWHDRAAFHFLTDEAQVKRYSELVEKSISENGFLIMGTFSENGPDKCSGIPISKYPTGALNQVFAPAFKSVEAFREDHQTPFETTQNFSFSRLQKV